MAQIKDYFLVTVTPLDFLDGISTSWQLLMLDSLINSCRILVGGSLRQGGFFRTAFLSLAASWANILGSFSSYILGLKTLNKSPDSFLVILEQILRADF